MQIDAYIILTLISAVILTLLGLQLWGIYIPRKDETQKLRTARIILSASYLLLAVPGYTEFFIGTERDTKIIAVFTLAAAAYQSLLFTATLLTFIQPLYVTSRRIVVQIGIITIAVAIFVPVILLGNAFWVFYLGLAAYTAQLIYYIRLFRRKYRESLEQLDEYYDDDQHTRVQWTKFGFYAALTIGIIASISAGLPPYAYNLFTITYTLFYTWFVTRFFNYIARANYYLPAISQPYVKEKTGSKEPLAGLSLDELHAREGQLRLALEKWVANKEYLKLDEGIKQIACDLETDINFLRYYFRTHMPADFRTWRNELRIKEACRIFNQHPEYISRQVSEMVGINDCSNFDKAFQKATGMTPKKYRETSNRKSSGSPE